MSLDAMVWAVKDAPVADVEERAILTVMADPADEDGCGSYLAVSTIAGRARLSTRTVQDRIHDMMGRKLLALGDQSLAARFRPDRRPTVYDLLIPYGYYSAGTVGRVNEMRSAQGLDPLTPESRPDITPPPPPKRRADLGTKRGSKRDKLDGASTTHPVEVTPADPDDPDGVDGVTTTHPVENADDSGTGCVVEPNGVRSNSDPETPLPAETLLRGAYNAPKPFEPEVLTPPTTGSTDTPRTRVGTPEPGEGASRFDEETRALLSGAVELVVAARPAWLPGDVRKAMIRELDAGRPAALVAEAVVRVARDPESDGPGRLRVAGPWWNPPSPSNGSVGGSGAEGPFRYLATDTPRCRVHPAFPADGCGLCRAERAGGLDGPECDAAPLSRVDAMATIRGATAAGRDRVRARDRKRPPATRAPRDDTPSGPVDIPDIPGGPGGPGGPAGVEVLAGAP